MADRFLPPAPSLVLLPACDRRRGGPNLAHRRHGNRPPIPRPRLRARYTPCLVPCLGFQTGRPKSRSPTPRRTECDKLTFSRLGPTKASNTPDHLSAEASDHPVVKLNRPVERRVVQPMFDRDGRRIAMTKGPKGASFECPEESLPRRDPRRINARLRRTSTAPGSAATGP